MKPTTNEDVIDVSDLLSALCERLGVKTTAVYRIDLETHQATIFRYAENEHGRKYLVRDGGSEYCGQVAVEPPLVKRITA